MSYLVTLEYTIVKSQSDEQGTLIGSAPCEILVPETEQQVSLHVPEVCWHFSG